MSRLLHSGTPLPKAIEKLGHLSSGQARASLAKVKGALDSGRTVGEAMPAGTPLISPLEACVFVASDRAGRLDAGLEQASRYYAALAEARTRMRSRLAYPVFVVHFALLILPLPLVFAPDGGLVSYFKAVGTAIGGLWLCVFLIAALVRALVSAATKHLVFDRLLSMVPLFGKLRRSFALSRFCSAYHMQLNAGVNVLASLETSAAASGSAILRDAVLRALPTVRSGNQVGPALAATRAFPKTFVRAFTVGEETGELDHELQRLGADYQTTALRRLETVAEWMPKIFYIAVLFYFGWQIIRFYIGRMQEIQSVMDK
ncbi:MAG: type II secretion system F family protein [Chthoniobacteraceae bacterium]